MNVRPWVPHLLRAAATLLAVAAAWGPTLSAAPRVARFVLLDVSAGCESAAARLGPLADDLGRGDTLRLATYGDGVVPARDADTFDAGAWRATFAAPGLPTGVVNAQAGATDLAAALAFAAANATGPDTGARMEIVVVSDGRATSRDEELVSAATALRRAGCSELSFVRLPRRDLGPRVASVGGPGRVRRGTVFAVVVDGCASASGGTVELVVDGAIIAKRAVAGGPFRIAFPDRATTAGSRVYEARVDGGTAYRPARAHVIVVDPGRALLLSDDPRRPGLGASLGVPYDVVPLDGEGLDERLPAYDVVVVDGVPSRASQQTLDRWMRRGPGVLLLDGPQDNAPGAGALVESSPLRSRPPDDPGAFLYVAVDGSGSMAELWPGGTLTRDEVVRAAVAAVLSEQPMDVTVALRRFNDRLQPVGSAPWTGRPSASGEALRRALADWPAPGGGTALVPVLHEALTLLQSRRERAGRVLVFTDGRFADDPADLASAARSLQAAGWAPAIVVDGESARQVLEDALAGTGAEVVMVADAFSLTRVLRDASSARGVDVLRDVTLRLADDVRDLPGLASPATAAAVSRRWPAEDAQVWLSTESGAPVAAVRRHGEGRLAALAARPADASSLADSAAARALISALRAAVERPSDTEARIERDGDRILVRVTGRAPTQVELLLDDVLVRIPLRSAPGGMLQADVYEARPLEARPLEEGPVGDRDGSRDLPEGLVRLLDDTGSELWTAGLDRPGPLEFVREREVDSARLTQLAGSSGRQGGVPLRPWFAGLAIVSLLAAQVISLRERSSRRGVLPIY